VVDALIAMRAAGAKLVVCTNKLTGLSVALLDALDLTRLVDAVVGADLSPAPKPDPRHLIAAVDAVGGDLRRTVMVGDAATDAGAAKAAGVPCLLVSFGYTETAVQDLGAEMIVDDFAKVPAGCAALLAR
jgi:phosphoglycolate phosphatase